MGTDIRAELAKQIRRPAHWLLLGVAAGLSLTFAYLVPYAGLSGATSGPPGSTGRGLESMLLGEFPGNAIAGLPVFAGALALIFGVLVVGSEYGWQTWKTVLLQRPSRTALFAAKLATVAVGTLVLVLVLLGAAAGASTVVTLAEDRALDFPPVTEVLASAGGGWLVATVWASLGVLLAVALRGVALPVGLGLVWLLAVQNLLAGVAAPLLDWVAELRKGLPGPNAGSLAASLGAGTDTPGIASLVAPGQATLVLSLYLVGFTLVAGWLLRRRDIE